MTPLSASDPAATAAIEYPDSDGQPMAENTLQFQWIVTIQGNIDARFLHMDEVLVAGDLFWYPVEGDNKIRIAPDVMVVFGRPRGHRLSYQQWLENNIPPQVVFEILSPSNRPGEMAEKFQFYEDHGVEEYYIFDPHKVKLTGYERRLGKFAEIEQMDGYLSRNVGARFDLSTGDLTMYWMTGERFLTFTELAERKQLAEQARDEAIKAREAADKARQEAEDQARLATERLDRLAAQLRALGIEPQP